MVVIYCVKWVCDCGEAATVWWPTEKEALRVFEEVKAEKSPVAEVWRFRVPRTKTGMVGMLNFLAEQDSKPPGEYDLIARHEDPSHQCLCEDCRERRELAAKEWN